MTRWNGKRKKHSLFYSSHKLLPCSDILYQNIEGFAGPTFH